MYHEDLVRYALSRAKEMEEDFSAADRYMADYKMRVSSIRSDNNLITTRNNNAVRCLDDWDY